MYDRLKPIDYWTIDDSTQVCAPSTEKDIIASVVALDPSAEEDNSDPPPIIKLTEAIQAVETWNFI